MRTLLVGLDDESIAFLREAGMPVEVCEDPTDFDIMDWMDPDLYEAAVVNIDKCGGVQIARGPRRAGINIPIIAITTGDEQRALSEQRALFLENGGDDLLFSPVNPRELVASVRSILRRLSKYAAMTEVFNIKSGENTLLVDRVISAFVLNDVHLRLTNQESSLMMALTARLNQVVSKESILETLYAHRPNEQPELKIIDVFVCKLRKKLADVIGARDANNLLKTEWGRGYLLKGDVVKGGRRNVQQ